MEELVEVKNTRCALGLWNESVPGISFDRNGVSNYARLMKKMMEDFPKGDKGERDWQNILSEIKQSGKGKKYDCILGVSGGTDSSYLLYYLKELGLNVLAVTFDNGWSSEISVKNIKKITGELDIDLHTYVVDFEEMKEIKKAYMRACLPWVDFPTDYAIKSVLFKTAKDENIKFIINGHDFRTEGFQPNEWTHGDTKQLNYIVKNFSDVKFSSYPYVSLFDLYYMMKVNNIKMVRPFFFIKYSKAEAQDFLQKNFGWEYYGGHHHENIFTKFAITYWLPKKFKIDKRIITLSAQILSGEITRENAISELEKKFDEDVLDREKVFVLKKLNMSEDEFNEIMYSPNKSINDYPSLLKVYYKYRKIIEPILFKAFRQKTVSMYLNEMEDKS